MKPDKASFKKSVKEATKAIQEETAVVASKLKGGSKAKETETEAAKAGATPTAKAKTTAAATPAAKPKRKAPVKKVAVTVPPILLEGDQPSATTVGGPGQRYALGPVPPPAHAGGIETTGELPEAYGTQQLLLTARDPHWLYARWDLTRQQQREYNALSADRHLVLRVYIDAVKGEHFLQVHTHPESTHWFIHVGRAGTKYIAQLGYFQPNGKWVGISTSEATMTPPDTMSDDITAQFATIPIEVPFAELMALANAAVRQNIPLAEIIQQLRAHGQTQFPKETAAPGKWTPEQERALSAIITMDRVRRVWMGSLEITELIRRQLQQDISSMSAAQLSLPTSPGGAISSVSSPFGGLERKKGFWFNVNAELIIYGATEPDAQVTIGGRVIKLRSDGTFSYRFALPDGDYELPAVAVSADQTDARAAELKFVRETEYRGDVGTHPQDPQLKAPLAANVS
ncbi:MAG: hypothetical protein JWR19_3249 [Pedosphaera sp.]|nr:hypothetical protein [Pedosphaera sp.]